MQKIYKNCQSCGMPFNKDENGGGTEANGEKSTMYCSHCYQDGKFTYPDATVDQMKQLVMNKMLEMKVPKIMAKLFVNKIPKLERWKV